MLSGVKLIPREGLLEHEEYDLNVNKQRKNNRWKKEKHSYNSSHEDEGLERDELCVGKKKKKRSGSWSCSDFDFDSFERVPNNYADRRDKSSKSRKSHDMRSMVEKKRDKVIRRNGDQNSILSEKEGSDVYADFMIDRDNGILRKEMGLEWMLQAGNSLHGNPTPIKIEQEHQIKEKHMDLLVQNSNAQPKCIRREVGGRTSRFIDKQLFTKMKKYEDDGDKYLAQKIKQNKRYSMSGNADDEYDFDEVVLSRKQSKKKDVIGEDKRNLPKRIMTQIERCKFCFENQSRPKHLILSIGNVTYMMLPPWEPVLQGHCCILPLQHESATRALDKNVWEEIRNFKKCLLKMFSRQDKVVIFIETFIGLSRQQRHCLIECIPIPSHTAKQAPLYFKKAIDEAEDEWGQHDMKKAIPTNGNLRNVIPENFSYFHVEFGLDRGFVHVIDDDSNFPSSFGLNVVRGMLRLPVETMHHHQRGESAEKQKQAVAAFAQEWELFDWTRELD